MQRIVVIASLLVAASGRRHALHPHEPLAASNVAATTRRRRTRGQALSSVALLHAIAWPLGDEGVRTWERFEELDANHDGMIDRYELESSVSRLAGCSDDRLRELLGAAFTEADANRDGNITLSELPYADVLVGDVMGMCHFQIDPQAYFDSARFAEVLEELDTDKDGFIGQAEFRKYIPDGGLAGSLSKSDRIFRQADVSGDGLLDVKELRSALLQHSIFLTEIGREMVRNAARSISEEADVNDDGHVDAAEFELFADVAAGLPHGHDLRSFVEIAHRLEEPDLQHSSGTFRERGAKQFRRYFSAFDANGSGGLDYFEVEQFVRFVLDEQ
mmetsp:Transcript_123736/g.357916  ORF Transcript_123736/g.357916 Transcript_123736/m.357916 type:complete len:331 (-) Transcript_123736:107-1099(-)